MRDQEIIGLYEAYASIYAQEEVEQLDEASPIYSRGGEQRRTQTPRQIGVKSAPHNIPKGGTTISDRDPEGKRLFTGDQDRGKGSKAAKRAAALKKEEIDIQDIIPSHSLDEAEGSYGQTPKATAAYGKLANKRRETPASGFAKRGDKTKQVTSAEKHHYRTLNPDAGNRGKKSTKPSAWSGKRSGMTQKDRDEARGGDEYGHTGYDPDWHGGPSAPGGKPKGKKLERQKKTGVSAESFDLFDYILEHLVAEGYADTNKAAIAIMANMSEDWRESIMEGLGGAKDQGDYWKREEERNERTDDELKKIKKRQNQRQKEQQAQEFLKKHPKK